MGSSRDGSYGRREPLSPDGDEAAHPDAFISKLGWWSLPSVSPLHSAALWPKTCLYFPGLPRNIPSITSAVE